MGLEQRNGNLYYYEKRRVGNRVISEYIGSGVLALFAARFAKDQAEEKAAKKKAIEKEREKIAELDAELDQITGWIELLSTSELIQSGYHQHKGQWRKRRNEKPNQNRKSSNRKIEQPE